MKQQGKRHKPKSAASEKRKRAARALRVAAPKREGHLDTRGAF